MVKRLANNKWQATKTVNNQRVRPTFNTEAEALAFEKGPITVGSHFRASLAKHWKGSKDERSAVAIMGWLIDHFGEDSPLTAITTASVTTMIDDLEETGVCGGTVNRKLAKLSKTLNYALDKDLIQKMPRFKFRKESKGRNRFLTPDEEARLFDRLEGKYRDFAVFLLYTGCRVSEALKANWSDISNGRITFWDTKSNGDPRTIPLHPRALAVLQITKGQGWIRPWSNIDYDYFHVKWTQARKASGFSKDPNVVPHILRHTCASRLAQSGKMDLHRLSVWLGHSNLSMTKRYAHLIPENLDEALACLEGQTSL